MGNRPQIVSKGNDGFTVPTLIAGDGGALRFLEFFTVNVRNKNTPTAYA
jgi:hypothetical protein